MAAHTLALIDPFHPRIVEMIRQGIPPDWHLSVASGASHREWAAAMQDADLAFVMATPLPAALIDAAPSLRFVQKLGAGVDTIDIRRCVERKIHVARLQAGNAIPVAEHTLMLMLSTCRMLPRLDARTRAGDWGKEAARGENRQLRGMTVGIIGFGAIGRQVARLLTSFGVTVLYYDPVPADAATEAELQARLVPLEELLAASDVVTLHAPLTSDTRNMIAEEQLAAMKPGVILINAARGGIVDEAALEAALRSGHVRAAGLDVFANEPPAGSPLLQLPNVVLTPHCAGATFDNFAVVLERALGNARRFLAGEPLPAGDVVCTPAA